MIGSPNWEPSGHFNIINNITQINGPIYAGTPGKRNAIVAAAEESKEGSPTQAGKTMGV